MARRRAGRAAVKGNRHGILIHSAVLLIDNIGARNRAWQRTIPRWGESAIRPGNGNMSAPFSIPVRRISSSPRHRPTPASIIRSVSRRVSAGSFPPRRLPTARPGPDTYRANYTGQTNVSTTLMVRNTTVRQYLPGESSANSMHCREPDHQTDIPPGPTRCPRRFRVSGGRIDPRVYPKAFQLWRSPEPKTIPRTTCKHTRCAPVALPGKHARIRIFHETSIVRRFIN